jgi:predicted Rossmann fold nucleotide-binding protein DprA/Smf involved in DNA uptake
LITVEDALKINVPVYSCFSHYLDESWQGTNQLIQKGQIKGIYDWKKFLREISQRYNLHASESDTQIELTPAEKEVLKFLKMWKNSLEELVMVSQLEIGELLNILSSLELKWVIYETVWIYFIK